MKLGIQVLGEYFIISKCDLVMKMKLRIKKRCSMRNTKLYTYKKISIIFFPKETRLPLGSAASHQHSPPFNVEFHIYRI